MWTGPSPILPDRAAEPVDDHLVEPDRLHLVADPLDDGMLVARQARPLDHVGEEARDVLALALRGVLEPLARTLTSRRPLRSGEQHRDALLGVERRPARELDQAGEPRRPRVADGDPRRLAREVVRLAQRLLGDEHGRAVGGEHAADDRGPVVGLVVEDALGDARRLLLPRPHHLGTVRPRPPHRVHDALGRRLVAGALAHAHERALERVGVRRLHGVDPRQAFGGLQERGVLEGADDKRSRARRRRPGRRAGRATSPRGPAARRARSRASDRPRS